MLSAHVPYYYNNNNSRTKSKNSNLRERLAARWHCRPSTASSCYYYFLFFYFFFVMLYAELFRSFSYEQTFFAGLRNAYYYYYYYHRALLCFSITRVLCLFFRSFCDNITLGASQKFFVFFRARTHTTGCTNKTHNNIIYETT